MYPPYHRDQMGYKGQSDLLACYCPESLTDFRQMTMARNSIGLEIIRGLGKQLINRFLSPCATHTRFGICNQMTAIHQAIFEQGQKPKLDSGRITPRIGDQACRFDGLPVDLREPID